MRHMNCYVGICTFVGDFFQTCFTGILIYTNYDFCLSSMAPPPQPSVGRWKVWACAPLLKLLSHRKDLCGCVVWISSAKLGVTRYLLARSRQKWGEVEVCQEDEVLVSRFYLGGSSHISPYFPLGEAPICQCLMLRSLAPFEKQTPRESTELVKSTDRVSAET